MDSTTLVLDFDSLTLDDLETFEAVSGLPFDVLLSGKLPAKALKGLVFILQRRDNPELTMAEVGSLPLSRIRILTPEQAESEGAADPNEAAPSQRRNTRKR